MGYFPFILTAFDNDKRSFGNLATNQIEKQICETLGHIQVHFHSAVIAFTELEKHDQIVRKIEKQLKTKQN